MNPPSSEPHLCPPAATSRRLLHRQRRNVTDASLLDSDEHDRLNCFPEIIGRAFEACGRLQIPGDCARSKWGIVLVNRRSTAPESMAAIGKRPAGRATLRHHDVCARATTLSSARRHLRVAGGRVKGAVMANEVVVGRLETSELLQRTVQEIAEGITGLAASERKDLILSIGHLFQRVRSGRFLQTLLDEWNGYRAKGRISDDYASSEQHNACLQEMLDFLDRDSPDEIRFSLLKKIFLVAGTESVSTRESVLPQQYLSVCRSLTSGEVLVLLAAFEAGKKGPSKEVPAEQWLQLIAEPSGLQYPELVAIHEVKLMDKNLITPRLHADRSGVFLGQHCRLTDLGYAICAYIAAYEPATAPG